MTVKITIKGAVDDTVKAPTGKRCRCGNQLAQGDECVVAQVQFGEGTKPDTTIICSWECMADLRDWANGENAKSE